MKIISTFSGCGSMDLGFKKAGFTSVLATDIWDVACSSLAKNNLADEVLCDDIKNIDFKKFKNKIDGVIGGPPCQPYSQTRHYLTNKKKGFDDLVSGDTVPQFIRVIDEVAPKFFLFENVDGFSYKTHKLELDYFLDKAKQLGYQTTFKVINTANYGIPQTRKRFICIGTLQGLPEFKFPEETHSKSPAEFDGLKPWVTCRDSIGSFDDISDEEKNNTPGGKHKEI